MIRWNLPNFKYDKWRGLRPYSKHSFYTNDKKFVKDVFNIDLPKDCGIKVFSNYDWQGTDFEEAAIIKNIFWLEGLAPRVFEVGVFVSSRSYHYFIVEHLKGSAKSYPQLLRDTAEKYHIKMFEHANGQRECEINSSNWIDGKYLDFGGWHLDKEWYKDYLKQEVIKTHYGKNVNGQQIVTNQMRCLKVSAILTTG
jgi:hypothetical protein